MNIICYTVPSVGVNTVGPNLPMAFTFPTTRPDVTPTTLWQLQLELLGRIERFLGPRDPQKQLYQPIFGAGGPHIINTPALDGAFAKLSLNAAGYWPTAVYELAHESIHLLNPIAGHTNFLEEGIAVAFSIAMSSEAGHAMSPEIPTYREALRLVQLLPPSPLEAGGQIRLCCGALSAATERDLSAIFPSVETNFVKRLCECCIPY